MSSLFPVAYFGSVAYYKKMVQMKAISFELFENYVKQTLRNRTTILGPNGIQNLSIPVIKPDGNKTLTKNIQISHAEKWEKIHWRAIESAYSPSPYFDHYGTEVKELIYSEEINLVKFNLKIHETIVSWLELPVECLTTHAYLKTPEAGLDFRDDFQQRQQDETYSYVQVFGQPEGFIPDLSILDAIFNLGPMARKLFIDK